MSTTIKKVQDLGILPGIFDPAVMLTLGQTGSMLGTSLSYDATDHMAPILKRDGVQTFARGARSSTAGNLEVHYINDFNADGTPAWSIMALAGDLTTQKIGVFDYVRSTNTTVTLANLEIIL